MILSRHSLNRIKVHLMTIMQVIQGYLRHNLPGIPLLLARTSVSSAVPSPAAVADIVSIEKVKLIN